MFGVVHQSLIIVYSSDIVNCNNIVGKDCIGCAKTGSGKTAAFALPILHKLSKDPYGIYALVLTPTRELAFQIGDQFTALGKPINVRVTVITGGRGEYSSAPQQSLQYFKGFKFKNLFCP